MKKILWVIPAIVGLAILAPPAAAQVTVTASPSEAVTDVGSTHTVTALVMDGGSPRSGAAVTWTTSGASTGAGQCITDSAGTCSHSYLGPVFPGADLITACVGSVSCGSTTVAWSPLISATPGTAAGGGQLTVGPVEQKVAFGFIATANQGADAIQAHCNIIDQNTDVHVRCLDAFAFVIIGPQATFWGTAAVNGVAETYQIDVTDGGEGGDAIDTFKIITDGGYAVAGTVAKGQIQVRS